MAGLFLMLYAGVALIQDKRLFTSAPKDVWEAIKPHKERFRGAHILGWILAILALLIMIGSVIFGAYDGIKNAYTYPLFLLRFSIMFVSLEIFDILFFDLFLLCNSHFYQHFYPETEGCEGFHKFGYNWKSHLVTFILVIIAAAGISGLCLLFN